MNFSVDPFPFCPINPGFGAQLCGAATLCQAGHTRFLSQSLIKNNASIELSAGASLTVYVIGSPPEDGTPSFSNSAQVNVNTADPSRFTLIYLGKETITFDNGATMHGILIAMDGHVSLGNAMEIFGGVIASSLTLSNEAKVHHDVSLAGPGKGIQTMEYVANWRE